MYPPRKLRVGLYAWAGSARRRIQAAALALLAATAALAGGRALAIGEIVLDDFSTAPAPWQIEEVFVRGSAALASAPGAPVEGAALRWDYELGTGPQGAATSQLQDGLVGVAGMPHVLITRAAALDLSWQRGLAFDLRTTGSTTMLFLALWDDEGRRAVYGPYAANPDFTTGYPEWHTLDVNFDEDFAIGTPEFARSRVRKVGLIVHGFGTARGTVWLDNLRAINRFGTIVERDPATFTPNGDGDQDRVRVRLAAGPAQRLSLEAFDGAGARFATIALDAAPAGPLTDLFWDGLVAGAPLPAGAYTLRATFTGAGGAIEAVAETSCTLSRAAGKAPLAFTAPPFFPIGAWFEGNPANVNIGTDTASAKAYFESAFAGMAQMGINCAAVPNTPSHLRTVLLDAAKKHNVNVVLEIGSWVALVMQAAPVTKQQVTAAAQTLVNQLKGYDNLIRYQIRDEPTPDELPNWITVQRALAKLDPRRPAFSCFLGWDGLAYACDHTLMSEAVFDIYPHAAGSPPQKLGTFPATLDAFMLASRGRPAWAVLQAFSGGFWRAPTPEEMRAETWLSLEAGAQGIFYFIYHALRDSSTDPAFPGGFVDVAGQPTILYEPGKALIGELNRLAPLLLGARRLGPIAIDSGDARAARFGSAGGGLFVIAASLRPDRAQSIGLALGLPGATWRDFLSGERFEADAQGRVALPLGVGAGRLLQPEGAAAQGWIDYR